MRKKINLRFFQRLPAREKRLTLSTYVTIARIILAPLIVLAMTQRAWGLAFGLFLGAVLTDILDGQLARLLKEQTFLGACLDPVADKILIVSVFFTLSFVQSPVFSIPLWFVWLVLIKELLQIVGAFAVYAIKGHIIVRPTILGKFGMFAQSSFIIWLFACYFFRWFPIKTYYTVLGVVIIVVLASFIRYAQIGIKQLRF